MVVVFNVDIDGVLARRNSSYLMKKCTSYFKLLLTKEQLTDVSWQEWLALPEVQAYREMVGEAIWERNVTAVSLDPAYQRGLYTIDGACTGTQLLANYGFQVRYHTCRKTTFDPAWNQMMVSATYNWLYDHHFPNPSEVVYCTSPLEKLEGIASTLRANQDQQIILVDDSYQTLLGCFGELSLADQYILSQHLRFTLCGFGAQEQQVSPVRFLPMPRWSFGGTENLLQALFEFMPVIH